MVHSLHFPSKNLFLFFDANSLDRQHSERVRGQRKVAQLNLDSVSRFTNRQPLNTANTRKLCFLNNQDFVLYQTTAFDYDHGINTLKRCSKTYDLMLTFSYSFFIFHVHVFFICSPKHERSPIAQIKSQEKQRKNNQESQICSGIIVFPGI